MPGHNYTGPGTNVLSKILAGIKPSNHNDSVSMVHDLDYEYADTIEHEIEADQKAASSYDNSIEGMFLSGAMNVKQWTTQVAHALGRQRPIMAGKSDFIGEEDKESMKDLIAHSQTFVQPNQVDSVYDPQHFLNNNPVNTSSMDCMENTVEHKWQQPTCSNTDTYQRRNNLRRKAASYYEEQP